MQIIMDFSGSKLNGTTNGHKNGMKHSLVLISF